MTPNRPHILVIEDNPADVDLLKLALQNAALECDLTVIDDGGDALAFTRNEGKYSEIRPPDLVMLDLNLPKNDGLEILEAMCMNKALDGVPVAVLSSSSSPRERSRIEKYSICRFITKPSNLDDFLAIGNTVKDLLGTSPERARQHRT